MLINARAVAITSSNIRASRAALKGSGIPAMSEPQVTRTSPAMTALIAPARLNPRISSSFRMGVTR